MRIAVGPDDYMVLRRIQRERGGWAELTPREREAVRCASTGASNKAIAHQMGISASTVSVLLGRASRRLGAADRDDLIRRCAEQLAAG